MSGKLLDWEPDAGRNRAAGPSRDEGEKNRRRDLHPIPRSIAGAHSHSCHIFGARAGAQASNLL
ncbi:MAG: hypothetical protein ACRERD_05225 [Candidatus Binatia bacterium]